MISPPSPADVKLRKLGAWLSVLTERARAEIMADWPDDEVERAERAFTMHAAVGWRANPVTMAAHLDPRYRVWRFNQLLAESFADAFHGIDPKQIWNMASQYGKTTSLMRGVVWALDENPARRIMYVSYDADKAVTEGGNARDFALAHADQLRFVLKPDRRARGQWETEEGGGLYCTGIHGGITGWPADALLLDDLFKGWAEAHSEAAREFVWTTYRAQCRMRMQNFYDPIIAAGTRWHEDDHFARLMKPTEEGGDAWKIIRLPTTAEAPDPDNKDPLLQMEDPLHREPGEILEPDRFNEQEVTARRIALGSYLHAAVEQQRPAPPEGGEIKRAWFKLETRMPTDFDTALSSWDMKLKDKESGDFVVGQVWYRTGTDLWLMDQLRGQWSQALTRCAIALMAVRWPKVRRHVVENTGYGPEVIEELRRADKTYEVSDEIAGQLGMTIAERAAVQGLIRRGLMGLIPQTVIGPKEVRARAHLGTLEAGNVHLPMDADWTGAFLDEMAAFPNGTFDDQVDTWSQAMKRLSQGEASVGKPPQGKVPQAPGVATATPPIVEPGRRRGNASIRGGGVGQRVRRTASG